jgi:hypothetical protein
MVNVVLLGAAHVPPLDGDGQQEEGCHQHQPPLSHIRVRQQVVQQRI